MDKAYSSSIKYSPSVRIGNWYEDLVREEMKINEFLTGKMLPDKEIIHRYYMKEIDLATPSPHIHFGDVVQLVAAEMKTNPKYIDCYPVLSIIVTNDMVLDPKPIDNKSELCVAPSKQSCIRNSFRIVSADSKDRTKEILKYGQEFMLECLENENEKLLLYCPPNSVNLTNISFSSYKNHLYHPLGLIQSDEIGNSFHIPKWHCYWKCIHRNPAYRYETEGEPVPSDTSLIVQHLATNQNLAAERYVIQTAFGKACLVSVKNVKDSHRIEQWPNIWKIMISKNYS